MNYSDIEITPEYERCLNLIDQGTEIVFVSGKAGTGKSVFIQVLRENYAHKRLMVLAPTGVAAQNVDGQTIHKLFLLPPMFLMPLFALRHANSIQPKRGPLFDALDIIVIDEISMVRADVLDTMDKTLQYIRHDTRPFGGVQVVLVGDIFQLPPVFASDAEGYSDYNKHYESEFFFSSEVIKQQRILGMMKTVILDKIFRQSDDIFINVLNNIRSGQAIADTTHIMNGVCYDEDASEEEIIGNTVLCTTNAIAQNINAFKLNQLKTPDTKFVAEVSGTFNTRNVITPEHLTLRVGAKVMMTKNDIDYRFINGSMGVITSISHSEIGVKLENDPDGLSILVERVEWQNVVPHFNKKKVHIEEKIIGRFKQFPMMLAWAVTIHKCMGEYTLVKTSKGQQYIKDLNIGDMVYTGKHSIRPITAVVNTGMKNGYVITTKLGKKIVCSGEHRLKCCADDKLPEFDMVSDIKIGQYLVGSYEEKYFECTYDSSLVPPTNTFIPPSELTFDWGWIIGALIGDGCYSESYRTDHRVDLINSDNAVLTKYTTILHHHGCTVKEYNAESSHISTMYINNKTFRSWLHTNGLEYVTARSKKVPNVFKYSTVDVRKGILSGLWDTDGYVAKSKAIFTTSSEQLCHDVQEMLEDLNVLAYINYVSTTCSWTVTVTGYEFTKLNKILNLQVQYKQHIVQNAHNNVGNRTNYDVVPFSNMLSSLASTMLQERNDICSRYNPTLWKRSKVHKTRNTLLGLFTNAGLYDHLPSELHECFNNDTYYDKIVSICPTESVQMYDIEVEDDHQFIANGIISHNSQGLTFDKLSIDLGYGAFASGQAYVAFSRCTSIEGIKLVRPLERADIIVNPIIVDFYNHLEIEKLN